jgi:DNA-binding MarR family transcriptional regulator
MTAKATVSPATTPAPATAADPTLVANRLRLSITRLNRILRHQSEESLAPTLSAVLATIDREGDLTLGELAAREHLAPPSITKAVEKLERLGYVTRRADDTDRRVARVRISAAGRRLLAQNRSRRTAWLATRLEGLPAEDVDRLAVAADILERLVDTAGGDLV